jgi:PAS domain S-box-containing protein
MHQRSTVSPFALSPSSQQDLYALSWANAPGGMFAFDAEDGAIMDVNPAAEALVGHNRDEILGLHLAMLHPEEERERVKTEILKDAVERRVHSGFHIQCMDGRIVPVTIRSSESLLLDGRRVMICVYRDISDLEQREHLLASKSWALSAYAGAALALGRKHTTESLFESICAAITRESEYTLAWIGIAEEDAAKNVRIAAAAGSGIGYMDGLHVSWSEDDPMGRGPTGICIRTGKVKIMQDSKRSKFFAPWRERASQEGIRSTAAIPILLDGDRRAALMIYAASPDAFEPAAIEVFQHLAEQMSHGIHAIEQEQLLRAERKHRAKVQTQLTEALSAMVTPIVTAMEMRDPYTAGHQSRVAEIAAAIAREMGWREEPMQGLRIAAAVHDVGKIAIPAEILTKPGRLSAAEWAMVREHPETGYTILKDIPFAWPIAEIVRQHHEKLDGSGYPLGLKGDAMLPEAKVLAVADIVEAMASNRPYRPAIALEIVLAEIESQAGSLLDADAVRICASLFREKRLTIPGPHGD